MVFEEKNVIIRLRDALLCSDFNLHFWHRRGWQGVSNMDSQWGKTISGEAFLFNKGNLTSSSLCSMLTHTSRGLHYHLTGQMWPVHRGAFWQFPFRWKVINHRKGNLQNAPLCSIVGLRKKLVQARLEPTTSYPTSTAGIRSVWWCNEHAYEKPVRAFPFSQTLISPENSEWFRSITRKWRFMKMRMLLQKNISTHCECSVEKGEKPNQTYANQPKSLKGISK